MKVYSFWEHFVEHQDEYLTKAQMDWHFNRDPDKPPFESIPGYKHLREQREEGKAASLLLKK